VQTVRRRNQRSDYTDYYYLEFEESIVTDYGPNTLGAFARKVGPDLISQLSALEGNHLLQTIRRTGRDMHREDQFIPHLIVSNGPAALDFYSTRIKIYT
jgi:hypothetical protein